MTLDVSLEQSSPASTDANPPIDTTTATSKILVQSGETIVLGGLISETRTVTKNGIPGVSQIPVLGAVAGTQNYSLDRNELILLLTPTVLETIGHGEEVVEELRKRLKEIDLHDIYGEGSKGNKFK